MAYGTVSAEEFYLDSPRNKGLFRFEIDNDAVWDKDSNFSNGWSLQYHTVRYATWEETNAPGFMKWVGKHFPTLGDEDSIVRYGHGLGQNMVTPGELSDPNPPPGDLPYAGTLTYTLNWQSFNRRTARNFQISVGVLGRESLAQDFQEFVHNDLTDNTDPVGWPTQRDTEPIINLAYQHVWRLAHLGTYTDGFAGQLSFAPGVQIGNLMTGADMAVALRIGWNIQEGFNPYPAPPGRGYFQAYNIPKPASASPHSVELVLAARGTAAAYSVLYDGSIITNDDRDIEREDFFYATLIGVNYHYYDYLSVRVSFVEASDLLDEDSIPEPDEPGEDKTGADNSYGTVLIDFYF
jgi:hypothetical protein